MASFFGVLGDIHGNFAAVDAILERHPEIPFWLCVGDVASATGAYPEPRAALYFIKGNNENFDVLEVGALPPNLHYVRNAQLLTLPGVTAAGVGGTFAPTWYETAASALPHPKKGTPRATEQADKRRHFVRGDVEACQQLTGIDVLLTHEAPSPFWIDLHPTAQKTRGGGPGDLPSSTTPTRRWRRDVGKPQITELADAVRPRLHVFGHHHVAADSTRNGITTICADRVNRTYLLVDAATFAWERRPAGDL